MSDNRTGLIAALGIGIVALIGGVVVLGFGSGVAMAPRVLVEKVLGQAPAKPAPEPTPNAEAPVVLSADKYEDRFDVMVTCGRISALMGRALDGYGVTAPVRPDEFVADNEVANAWGSARSAAADALLLKATVCEKGGATKAECDAYKSPAFAALPPLPVPEINAIYGYCDQLFADTSAFVDAGCKVGRATSNDPMFCSVE